MELHGVLLERKRHGNSLKLKAVSATTGNEIIGTTALMMILSFAGTGILMDVLLAHAVTELAPSPKSSSILHGKNEALCNCNRAIAQTPKGLQ
jgi:hypothetical protein